MGAAVVVGVLTVAAVGLGGAGVGVMSGCMTSYEENVRLLCGPGVSDRGF